MIKFVRFNGTLKEWNDKLSNNAYNDSIVYACVWNNGQPSYKIYAGISDHLGPNKETVKYLYDIPSAQEWEKTIESVNNIVKQLTNINKDINYLKETTQLLDSSIKNINEVIEILNSDETVEGSIQYQIIKALEKYKITADDFAKLIDKDSNVKVEVVDSSIKLTVDSVNKAKITTGNVDPDEYTFEEDPAHGDYYVKEEVITEKLGAEPRRTAYIYIDNKWHVLDGNVDATNVFFKDGVDRTAAIGCLSASDEIKNEGKNFNLKELLEYYLVQEIYPANISYTTAIAKADNYSIKLEKPKSLSSYMNSTSTLAEVGTNYTFNGVSLSEKATHDGKNTYTSTKSTITGMKFGAAPSLDSEVDPNKTSDESEVVIATAAYTENFTDAQINIELSNKGGFTNIENATNSINNLTEAQTLSLSAQTGTIIEGTNKLSLSWNNNANVSRELTGDAAKQLGPWYYASNKGNIDASHKVQVNAVKWTQTSQAIPVTYSTTEFAVTGVYALYTNGGKVSLTPTKPDSGCVYADNYIQLPLYNYYSETTKTFYIQFGAIPQDQTKFFELYFPKSSKHTFTITSAYAYNTNNGKYDATTPFSKADDIKMIEGKEFLIYRCKELGQGANEVEIKIKKD